MPRAIALWVALCALIAPASADAATAFTDDFENGLGNWVIGGRQTTGTNTADTVQRYGSSVGHLFKFSFTEITLERTFSFDPNEVFRFQMEVAVSSTPPPDSTFFGQSGADFFFLDSSGQRLGRVSYAAATTDFPFTAFLTDPTVNINEIAAGQFASYVLSTSSLLAQIDIDPAQIANTLVTFRTYASSTPSPSITAELWVDNFSTVPEPGTALLVCLGLVGLSASERSRKRV